MMMMTAIRHTHNRSEHKLNEIKMERERESERRKIKFYIFLCYFTQEM